MIDQDAITPRSPIGIHHESCSPVHDTTVVGGITSATVQFYGPVLKETSDKMPVKVYREDFGGGGTALDVTSSFSAIVLSTDRKQLEVTGPFNPRYRYYINPIVMSPGSSETILLCDDLTTLDEIAVDDDVYWFDVDIAFASLDLGGNGIIDTADAALWVIEPVDFNGDNVANTTDLDLITSNLGRTE